jgi:hypothetical protein
MSVNDITGDVIKTDVPSKKYKGGWELIWGDNGPSSGASDEELIEKIVERDSKNPVPESCTRSPMVAS